MKKDMKNSSFKSQILQGLNNKLKWFLCGWCFEEAIRKRIKHPFKDCNSFNQLH